MTLTHTHTIPCCFCTQFKSVCSALLLSPYSTTSNAHTHLQTRCFYVSECVLSPARHCIKVHGSSASRVARYRSVITAATGGLFSRKKKPFAFSPLQPTGITSCSPAAPPPLPCLLLPDPQFSEPGRADVRVLRDRLPIAETAGRRSLMGRENTSGELTPLNLTTQTALNLLEMTKGWKANANKHTY